VRVVRESKILVMTRDRRSLEPLDPEAVHPATDGKNVLSTVREFVTDAPEELSLLVLSGHVPVCR